ncbi:phosphatase PAP2 family protein [Lapidilactobacillus salsurivasis]
MTSKKTWPWLVGILYLAFAGFIWGVVTQQQWIHNYDNLIYGWLAPWHPAANNFFIAFTKVGNPLIMTILTAVILVVLIWAKHWRLGVFIAANNGLGALLNHVIKGWIQRPRPTDQLIRETGFSFPSGHSTAAVMFFGSLIVIGYCLVKSKKWRIVLAIFGVLLIILLGLSRLYVHVHYPSDVTAGFLFASANLILHWQVGQRYYLSAELPAWR